MSRSDAGSSLPSEDCRCVCGRLVARIVREGIELKCRRCRRTLRVALPGGLPRRLRELEVALEPAGADDPRRLVIS